MGRTEVETFNADSSFITEAEFADLENNAFYPEINRTAGLITSIDSWDTPSKIIQRFKASFVRVNGFINIVTQEFFDYQGILYRKIVSTITRNPSNEVITISHTKTPAGQPSINY